MLANCLLDTVTAAFLCFLNSVISAAGREGGRKVYWTGWERIGEQGLISQFLAEMAILRIIVNLALHLK